MTLKEFVSESKEQLDAFFTYWESNAQSNPECFTMEMGSEDFDEMFVSWLHAQNNIDSEDT